MVIAVADETLTLALGRLHAPVRGTRGSWSCGAYQVLSLLGAGSMGEVYRARDPRLGRDVAIKVLPTDVIGDRERRARFEREARVLATLNHPRIGAIYGIEEYDGAIGLVLELVEGPTLEDRLRAEPLPMSDALVIARQIAEALEAAHENGVIHRDLKPANIKIARDGSVKVLDFGLAKVRANRDAGTASTLEETREGVILGTPAYMSPEQARGRRVDQRADIWAFGCVLYEMLTGRRAFDGESFGDVLTAVTEREPEWAALPESAPASIVRLLCRCFEKDPHRRLHAIADARLEIDAAEAPAPAPVPSPSPRAACAWARTSTGASIAAVLLMLTGIAGCAMWSWTRHPEPPRVVRLAMSAPGLVTPQFAPALSPDGRQLAFVSTDAAGRDVLWIRPLDVLEPRALPGTEHATHPFWSPDGRSIGFIADYTLKKIDVASGHVQTVADHVARAGATWSQEGVILFVPEGSDGMARVSSSGGPVRAVMTADGSAPRVLPAWPQFLPDGRHFLYFGQSSHAERRGVYIGALDSNERRHLLRTDFKAVFAPPASLLFAQGDSLMAQAFDPWRLELTGEPAPVAEGVWAVKGAGQVSAAAAAHGVLAYVNAALVDTQLVWFDRRGHALGTVGPPAPHRGHTPQLSPDGTRLAIARGPWFGEDIWLSGLGGGFASRLTFGPGRDSAPAWSADGARIVFASTPGKGQGTKLYVKEANGAGVDKLLLDSPAQDIEVEDWSSDGRFVVYSITADMTGMDLWALPLDGKRRPFPVVQGRFNQSQAQVSPDGRWIAYTSNESGRDEIYVQSFPKPGSKRQLSTAGGVQPRWRRQGGELFYLADDQTVTAIPVRTGATLESGPPAALFKSRLAFQSGQSSGLSTLYDVTPDGRRLLLNVLPEASGPPITVVLNWPAAQTR